MSKISRFGGNMAVMLVISSVALSPPSLDAQESKPVIEHWVNPGIGPGAPRDIDKFVQTIDAAFVGVLQDVQVRFLPDGQLFTKLTFHVDRWMQGDRQTLNESIDVLTRGGTYVEIAGQRTPRKPAEIAQHLRVGDEYFVPVMFEEEPGLAWSGGYVLAWRDALSRFEGGEVFAVMKHSDWAQQVIRQGPGLTERPALPRSNRDVFLESLRAAAGRRR